MNTRFERSPWFFVGSRPYVEAECAAHILREHARGRPLVEVLKDRYLERVDRCVVRAVLRNPKVIRALADHDASAIRALRAEMHGGRAPL